MRVWRISNFAGLSGIGGVKFSARWHNRGRPIVYTAEHPALAMLEILAHTNSDVLPDTYQLLEIEVPDFVKVQVATPRSGWQINLGYSREFGDAWLASASSAVLQVPSAIMPHAMNYLINPEYPEAPHITIVRTEKYELDQRLK